MHHYRRRLVSDHCGRRAVKPIKDRIQLGLDIKGGVYVVMEAKNTKLKGDELRDAMEQTQAVIEERVNQLGLAEPVVTIEGDKRIRVELPGAEDAEEAISQIGKTAQLQFALADGTIVLDGGNVKDAQVTTDSEKAGYAVSLQFDSDGADASLSGYAESLRRISEISCRRRRRQGYNDHPGRTDHFSP